MGPAAVVTQGRVKLEPRGPVNRWPAGDVFVQSGQQLAADSFQPQPAPRGSHLLDWTRDLMAAAESPLVPASEYDGGALVAVDPYGQEAKLSLRNYHVDVHIEDGFARTTIDQTYFNNIALAAGGHVLLPAAAGRLAVAPGHVRGRQPHGRRHGRARMGQCRLREDRPVPARPGPARMGGRQHVQDARLPAGRAGRRSASSSATRSGCRRSTAARSTASRPATACKLVDHWSFHARVKNGAGATGTAHRTRRCAAAATATTCCWTRRTATARWTATWKWIWPTRKRTDSFGERVRFSGGRDTTAPAT